MRAVSLVPSLTEAVAVTLTGVLAGATDWCTHPAGLDVVRVGGTKNPKTDRILSLAPDLVIANEEENRPDDLAALRAAGVEVLVTEVRTVSQAFTELDRVLAACGAISRPRWLDEAEAAWAAAPPAPAPSSPSRAPSPSSASAPRSPARAPAPSSSPSLAPERRRTAVVPIWRRPWMVLGRDTFAGDVLARLGVDNLYGPHAERYPKIAVEELRAARPDVVVLPDEPYRFTAGDGPEAFPGLPCALVDGRCLTWYGPSLAEAPRVLDAALRAARR
ncbi:ABC transporter substrate-binding protein [Streptomyces ambofaciens]|uniref:ABC transporter substrate-binding protein n=1 Tax=Streptomyces ambofaciens TaxID=1889 RepID=A0ABM6AVS8_STRAM|nr:helical backbone metal receptor [Streptomyces ambofaciens]ANB05455.1 ABC transporter substrate-binding protein [Streptomyces ambofaciens]